MISILKPLKIMQLSLFKSNMLFNIYLIFKKFSINQGSKEICIGMPPYVKQRQLEIEMMELKDATFSHRPTWAQTLPELTFDLK